MAIYRVLITAKIKHGQIKRNFLAHRTSLPTTTWRQMSEALSGSASPVYRAPCHSGGWTRKVRQWKATAISLSLSFIFVLLVLPRRLSWQVRERMVAAMCVNEHESDCVDAGELVAYARWDAIVIREQQLRRYNCKHCNSYFSFLHVVVCRCRFCVVSEAQTVGKCLRTVSILFHCSK